MNLITIPGAVRKNWQPNTVRAGRARYVNGSTFRGKLQGQSAIVLIDPTAPWLVLAQFDEFEENPHWGVGWHPLPASSFGPIEWDHVIGEDDSFCTHCKLSVESINELGEFACSVRP